MVLKSKHFWISCSVASVVHLGLLGWGSRGSEPEPQPSMQITVAMAGPAARRVSGKQRDQSRRERPRPPAPGQAKPNPGKSEAESRATTDDHAPAAIAAESRARYEEVVAAWIRRHQFYPQLAQRQRHQGIARVEFVLTRDGRLVAWKLLSSSGHVLLDQAAGEILRSAAPFPAIPPEVQGQELSLHVPIRFHLQ